MRETPLKERGTEEFLGHTGYERYTNEGAEYSLRRRDLGIVFLIFIPVPLSQREEGFLSLFNLDLKCHGIDA